MGRSLLLSGHCRERPDIYGDSKVTGGEVAAAVLQRDAIAAIVSVARVIAARSYHFVVAVWRAKRQNAACVKRYWEIIADNLSKAGWSWGCVSAINDPQRLGGTLDLEKYDNPSTYFWGTGLSPRP